jgi:hypothetical protein
VGVAQLVELLVVVQVVAGSSPVAHPPRSPVFTGLFAFHAGRSLRWTWGVGTWRVRPGLSLVVGPPSQRGVGGSLDGGGGLSGVTYRETCTASLSDTMPQAGQRSMNGKDLGGWASHCSRGVAVSQ